MWPFPESQQKRQKFINAIEDKKLFISRYAPGVDIEKLSEKPIQELERTYRLLMKQMKEEKEQREKQQGSQSGNKIQSNSFRSM